MEVLLSLADPFRFPPGYIGQPCSIQESTDISPGYKLTPDSGLCLIEESSHTQNPMENGHPVTTQEEESGVKNLQVQEQNQ